MKRNAKIFCAALALVLVFGAVVGGTLAWLMDTTESVVNTFTVGNVKIKLEETVGGTLTEADESVVTNDSFKMVPGNVLDKDPTVTVLANSEDCYLFVKVKESADFAKYITYGMAPGWTALGGEGNDGVYYREVTSSTENTVFDVIGYDADGVDGVELDEVDKVYVNATITQEMMNAIAAAPDELNPTLTFTAYACQMANIDDAAAAWAELNPPAQNG